jgi:hypothetical protein
VRERDSQHLGHRRSHDLVDGLADYAEFIAKEVIFRG